MDAEAYGMSVGGECIGVTYCCEDLRELDWLAIALMVLAIVDGRYCGVGAVNAPMTELN